MKARLYLQPCFFSCACVCDSLTQIPQIPQDLHA